MAALRTLKGDPLARELNDAVDTRLLTQAEEATRPQGIFDVNLLRAYVSACDRLGLASLDALILASPFPTRSRRVG